MPGGGGVEFLLKISGGGVSRRGGPRGREGVCSKCGNWGGGGLNIFFRAEMSTKKGIGALQSVVCATQCSLAKRGAPNRGYFAKFGFSPKAYTYTLDDRNLLKLRSLDSSFPFFLSDNSIWGQ